MLIFLVSLATILFRQKELGGKVEEIIRVKKNLVGLNLLPGLVEVRVGAFDNFDNMILVLENKAGVEIEKRVGIATDKIKI